MIKYMLEDNKENKISNFYIGCPKIKHYQYHIVDAILATVYKHLSTKRDRRTFKVYLNR